MHTQHSNIFKTFIIFTLDFGNLTKCHQWYFFLEIAIYDSLFLRFHMLDFGK